MLKNRKSLPLEIGMEFLNEVLSLNAQECPTRHRVSLLFVPQ